MEQINNGATPTYTYSISADQYLSDIADKLPTENGIHLINAVTGTGKTHFMLDHAETHGGTCCTPTKAINQQKRGQFETRRGRAASITQLEHFKDLDIRKVKCIHFDECQTLYNSGYRGPAIDAAITKIEQAAKRMPVYLWTATADPTLIPLPLASITHVNKPFKRDLTVIQLDTNAMVKVSHYKLARCIHGVFQTNEKPVLFFLDDEETLHRIAGHLKSMAMTSVVISSETTDAAAANKKSLAAAHRAFHQMIRSETVAGAGVDVVLTTKCNAEGIDFHDDFNVVSVQTEPGLMFQQQGRARGQATHWIIAGNGQEPLFINNGDAFKSYDGVTYRMQDRSATGIESRISVTHPAGRQRAIAFGLYSMDTQWGAHAGNVLRDFFDIGAGAYRLTDLMEFDDTGTKLKSSMRKVTPKTLADAVSANGGDVDLTRRYDSCNAYTALADAYGATSARLAMNDYIDWKIAFNSSLRDYLTIKPTQRIGIRLDDLSLYTALGSEMRKALLALVRDEVRRTVAKVACAEFRADCKEFAQRGKITITKATGICDEVFEQIFPMKDNPRLWTDKKPDANTDDKLKSPAKQRAVMMLVLAGCEQSDGDEWIMGADPWAVPVTNADGKRARRNEKTITDAGVLLETFYLRSELDRQELADMPAKQLKQGLASMLDGTDENGFNWY